MQKSRMSFSAAFTIVELLVVIVVIGVLATITIIAYTGISAKAIETSMVTDLANSSKRLKLFQVENSGYPASITDCPTPAAGNLCVKPSGSNTIATYVKDNSISPQGFCINLINGNKSYKITSTKYNTPVLGDCTAVPILGSQVTNDSASPGTYGLTIPSDVTLLNVEVYGGAGGNGGSGDGGSGGWGGLGGAIKTTIMVSPGDVVSMGVGSRGTDGSMYGSGSVGTESYIKVNGVYKVRGYGGTGGGPGYMPWYCFDDIPMDECGFVNTYYDGHGVNGTQGGNFLTGQLAMNTSSNTNPGSGNGRVLIKYTPGETYSDFATPQTTTWTVPNGVVSVRLVSQGAQGGAGGNSSTYARTGGVGGLGGCIDGFLVVASNDILDVSVGSQGSNGSDGTTGGNNGTAGGESYVKKFGVYKARGYGGSGGVGASNVNGAAGNYNGGFNSGDVTLSGAITSSMYKSGNGRVLFIFSLPLYFAVDY